MSLNDWTALLQKYTAALCAAGKSSRTAQKYTADTKKFLQFLGEKALDAAAVNAYSIFLRSHYQASTCNSYLISVNGFLRFLGQEELILPLRRIQQNFSLENELSTAEYRRILTALRWDRDPKFYYIARTLAGTGIRVGELPFFTVHALERGWTEIELKGKVRQVFLPDALQEELRAYCAEFSISSGSIFLNRARTAPVDSSLVWRSLKRAARRAGVPEAHVYPHNLRHLFARSYMEIYSDILDLADILGHSSVETTRIYTRTSRAEKIRRISGLKL